MGSGNFDQIRTLFSEIEEQLGDALPAQNRALVSGLELPDIMRDVVDYLLPELKPYEAVFYMYMLRHSVIQNGNQLTRVSRRGLQSGVVKSVYSDRSDRTSTKTEDTSNTSYQTIKLTLEGLEAVGAISRQSEPNREGTLYKVLLPEEIKICQEAKENQRNTMPKSTISELSDVDFYNIRENRIKIYERDNYHCKYCEKQLTRFTATLDHVHPVKSGGDNSYHNLVTCCLDCNSKKNMKPLGDFLAER